MSPYLSIVIPIHDEVENLTPLSDELLAVLEKIGHSFEVVFVDDGSRDGSAEALDRMVISDSRIRILHLEARAGQTAALDAGFRASRGEIVVTMDADLQNDPVDIPALLEWIGPYDAVAGYRGTRRDRWARRVSSRIANAIRNYLSGESIRDTGCSLKAYRRECLLRIRLYDGMHRFLPTLIKMEGFSVAQVEVSHRPRLRGRSKYDLRGRLFRSSLDLLAVRWMKKRRLCYRIRREAGGEAEGERRDRVAVADLGNAPTTGAKHA